jgi:4-hydroxybenzoate polyprenyltransferase
MSHSYRKGWSAMANAMNWTVALPLYASGVCWTLVYDTIYALQDRKDDMKVGIKSTALLSQGQTKTFLSTFAVGQVSFLTLVGILNGHGLPYYLISVGGSAIHLIWQIVMLKTDSVKDAWDKFASNIWLGALVLSGFWADIFYRKKQIKSPANVK